jgi:prephenate dehydrogenase
VRVAFLGLGLIGGSIARGLRSSRPGATIAAWTPSGAGPAAAADAGVVDAAAPTAGEALKGAAVVVLAAPPSACLELVDALAGPLRDHVDPAATVTDVASTKAAIVARADAAGLRFVGGHPMAGRELSGFGNADPDLFRDRPWIIVPGHNARPEDRAAVEDLAAACGAHPLSMTAADHDAAVAAISHLPLVVAAALVESVAGGDGPPRPGWAIAGPLAAGGWRGMTRLARGDVEMGAGIAATSPGPIAAGIRELVAVLDAWLAELERPGGPDEAAIRGRLAAARRRLEEAG